jgi:hypothetical protein
MGRTRTAAHDSVGARSGCVTRGPLRGFALAGVSVLVLLSVVVPGSLDASAAGSKWTLRAVPVASGYSLRSVACSGEGCVGLATECGIGGCGGLLPADGYRSANLGVSWKDVAITHAVGDANAISCGSPDLCVATALKGPLGPHSSSAILVTRNGGTSWAVDDEPGYNLGQAAACGSASSCVTIGTPRASKTTLASVGLVTTNAGKSWTKAAFPANKAYITSAACASATACVAMGENSAYTAGVSFFSTNVGKSWKETALPSGATSIQAVSCDGLDCAAITTTQVLVSRNGGKSWTMHLLPSAFGLYLRSVACLSGAECVAVGYQTASSRELPVAEISGNGGSSWAKQSLPKVAGSLNGVACLHGTCVAVGVKQVYKGAVEQAEYSLALTY